jgi:signal transduction histidine kinase
MAFEAAPDHAPPDGAQPDSQSERFAALADELGHLINSAILAFDVLKTGNVGVSGVTSVVLHRSLLRASELVSRAQAEVRLGQGLQKREPFLVGRFIDELAPVAILVASAQDVKLMVLPVDDALTVEADREILAAVLMNLLQNAVKFTRPQSTVTLRVDTTADRVRMHVQDECGGLAPGDPDELFGAFEQGNGNRSGRGLGLAFNRRAVEANDGTVYACSLPGSGCVFTVDLPRHGVCANTHSAPGA